MKKGYMILLGIIISFISTIGLFIAYLSFSSTSNLSEDIRFKTYLNKSIIVKQQSALKQTAESSIRFSPYFIDNYVVDSNEIDKTILKIYKIGDTIIFNSAKGYFSNHVGETYYLLGNEKLNSGETIEFEYYAGFEYSPAIWETDDEFLARRESEKKIQE